MHHLHIELPPASYYDSCSCWQCELRLAKRADTVATQNTFGTKLGYHGTYLIKICVMQFYGLDALARFHSAIISLKKLFLREVSR